MTSLHRETRRLAGGLVVSGAVTLLLAFTAMAFPEATLIPGMLIVGLLSVLFGLNQVLTSVAIRMRTPYWRLVLTHGLLTVSFGLLTVGGTALSFGLLLGVVVGWLASHGLLAARIAMTAPSSNSIRSGLVASTVLDVAVAILAIVLRPLTIFQFLFFGAAYAAVFGTIQILGGVFLRRARLDRFHHSPVSESSNAVAV